MAVALASTDDLADVWRPLTAAEIGRVSNLLDKASALLRQNTPKSPSIDDRIALFESDPDDPMALDPVLVASVVATIVKRFVTNIDGAVSRSQAVDGYSESVSFALRGNDDVRGELIVTESDLKALRPFQGPSLPRSIRVNPWPGCETGPAVVGRIAVSYL